MTGGSSPTAWLSSPWSRPTTGSASNPRPPSCCLPAGWWSPTSWAIWSTAHWCSSSTSSGRPSTPTVCHAASSRRPWCSLASARCSGAAPWRWITACGSRGPSSTPRPSPPPRHVKHLLGSVWVLAALVAGLPLVLCRGPTRHWCFFCEDEPRDRLDVLLPLVFSMLRLMAQLLSLVTSCALLQSKMRWKRRWSSNFCLGTPRQVIHGSDKLTAKRAKTKPFPLLVSCIDLDFLYCHSINTPSVHTLNSILLPWLTVEWALKCIIKIFTE